MSLAMNLLVDLAALRAALEGGSIRRNIWVDTDWMCVDAMMKLHTEEEDDAVRRLMRCEQSTRAHGSWPNARRQQAR